MNNLLLIISGPAGSGKNTVSERLMAEFPDVKRVITSTSRQPRGAEKDGVDYHFLSKEEFERGIGNGDFYEYAKVHDRYYGTSKNAINDTQGGDKILIIDVQGAATWRKIAQENPQIKSRLTTIFVAPDNEQELRKRLLGRNTESQEEIDRRMQTAIEEFKQADKFDIRIQSKSKDEDYNALREIYLNLKSKNS